MADAFSPPKDHNQSPPASKATFLAHLRKLTPAKRAVEEAQAEYRHLLKAAKKDGINTGALTQAMALRKLDPDAVAKDQADLARYMAFMGLPIGSQGSLFGQQEPDTVLTTAEQAEQAAFDAGEAGYAAGRAGRPRGDNPNNLGTEAYVVWDRGWVDGQGFLAKQLGDNAEKIAAPKRGRGRPRKVKPEEAQAEATPEPSAGDDDEAEDDIDFGSTVH